jgi:hypothetical protein
MKRLATDVEGWVMFGTCFPSVSIQLHVSYIGFRSPFSALPIPTGSCLKINYVCLFACLFKTPFQINMFCNMDS